MTAPALSETDLLHLLIERAPYALPGIHIDRRAIINTQSVHGFRARNGIAGQADAFAIYRGRHLELETKAAKGTMREAQKRWRARCLRPVQKHPLCPHLVLRAGAHESPEDTVNRWIEEIRAALTLEA